jgi:phosphate transport system substrate-binding protein
MMKKIAVITAAVFAVLSLQAKDIAMKGSDTLLILAQKWAEMYMQQNPGSKIQVTGGGSGTGFAALQNQTTDLANASRKIKAKEIEACIKAFGKRPKENKVALDGLSVYVNERNNIQALTISQLESIFSGQTKNWKELGGPDLPITIISRENSSGTYEFFKEHILRGKDFASSAQTMAGTAAVLQAVSKDPKAIGYGGAAYGQGAKHLAVKKDESSPAIEPSEENIINGTYPIWRFLYIYVNPALDSGEVHHYLSWIKGAEGQKLVKEVGYYPLPKNYRE